MNTVGRIYISDWRAKAGGIPAVHIDFRHKNPEVLYRLMEVLGLRKSLSVYRKRTSRKYRLVLGEKLTKRILELYPICGDDWRQNVGLEIIYYKEKNEITKNKNAGEEHKKALEAFETLVKNYFYAQCWDPQGWFWKPVEEAEYRIRTILSEKRRKQTNNLAKLKEKKNGNKEAMNILYGDK